MTDQSDPPKPELVGNTALRIWDASDAWQIHIGGDVRDFNSRFEHPISKP
jgi:hypothetical protein